MPSKMRIHRKGGNVKNLIISKDRGLATNSIVTSNHDCSDDKRARYEIENPTNHEVAQSNDQKMGDTVIRKIKASRPLIAFNHKAQRNQRTLSSTMMSRLLIFHRFLLYLVSVGR